MSRVKGFSITHIYYGVRYDLNEEVFYFQLPDLLSDIGGTISLWLGISVITAFELIEIVLDGTSVCWRKIKKIRKNSQVNMQIIHVEGK